MRFMITRRPPRRIRARNSMKTQRTLYAGLLTALLWTVPSCVAQTPTATTGTPAPIQASFPTSPRISALPLSEELRNLLVPLVTTPDRDQKIERARKQLCPAMITPPAHGASIATAALALTETDMSVEISFEKRGSEASPATPRFALLVDFREYDILVRSSQPRFPSEAGGLLLMPDKVSGRAVWMEGKGGADVLVLVPPISECGIKGIAVCPRSFVPRTGLQRNGYTAAGARYFYSAKTDGLFATDKQNPGRIRASILASAGLPLPEKWFDEQLSGVTPAATLKHTVVRPKGEPGSFSSVTLPAVEAVEARLEFGRGDTLLRTISNRTLIELSAFDLPEKKKVVVHFSDTPVEAGSCFLITKWSETQL
jgi:hypothetical protein